MNNIDYQHSIPESFQSKLIQTAMSLFGMKKNTERKMLTNGFKREPAKIPGSLSEKYKIIYAEQRARKIWTVSPINSTSDLIIIYFHGGAYVANLRTEHWNLIDKLIGITGATVIIPDYPLAPEANCTETYDFIKKIFSGVIHEYPEKHIVFMGDSAGGGLALGFTQQLRNENKKQPDQVIMFSPWLDVTMCNPLSDSLEKDDKLLSVAGLKNAGQTYAATLDLKDFRVSPVYGDLRGLCRISLFTGARDILNADAQKLKQKMKEQNISFNYFEYPYMFHDWVIVTSLKESVDVMNKVGKLLKEL